MYTSLKDFTSFTYKVIILVIIKIIITLIIVVIAMVTIRVSFTTIITLPG
jgi:hypothetical protein